MKKFTAKQNCFWTSGTQANACGRPFQPRCRTYARCTAKGNSASVRLIMTMTKVQLEFTTSTLYHCLPQMYHGEVHQCFQFPVACSRHLSAGMLCVSTRVLCPQSKASVFFRYFPAAASPCVKGVLPHLANCHQRCQSVPLLKLGIEIPQRHIFSTKFVTILRTANKFPFFET